MNSDSSQSISVVIPTMGDRAEYLRQAIECVVSQSIQPSEVIIVNNGESSLMNFEYPQGLRFPLIVLNTVLKAGASQARNFGATVAKGRMIAFLDDDDLWASNYLEEMHKVVLSEGSDCVVSRIAKLQNNEVSNLFDASNYLTPRFFLVMNPGVTGSNLMIDKKLFLSLGGYDCRLQTGEDGDLILKVLDSGGRVAMCDSTKAVMRVHNGARLTDSTSLSSGYRSLYLKYKSRVGVRDKIYLFCLKT
jgi:glycosyltransferase involved in cell wall biosynthesis